MKETLYSEAWPALAEKIRKCHLSLLNPDLSLISDWKDAFDSLMNVIKEERKYNPGFAIELKDLTTSTGFIYDFVDIFEEYFDHLEENKAYDIVIESANQIVYGFQWVTQNPSEYMYRIGNALLKLNKLIEAEEFGKKWLANYPNDCYAQASNVFLLVELGRLDDAEKLTEKYLPKDLICEDKTLTIFMAAERLYEVTNNSYAKERIAKKIAEYNTLIQK